MNEENQEVQPEEVAAETQEVQSQEEGEVQVEPQQTEEDKEKAWKNKVQKRFDKLTARAYEKDARIAELEAQLQQTQKFIQHQESNQKPVIDQFDTQEEFIEALTDWKLENKLTTQNKQQEEARKKKSEQERILELQNDFVTHSKVAMEKHKDYLEATAGLDIQIESELGQNIMECGELGPEIMYFLGKNPDIEDKLLSLKGARLSREIGKIEAKLSAPIKKKVTKAPEPITPNRTAKTTGVPNGKKFDHSDLQRAIYG